jgi:SAM-dependent methyltransferase
MQQPTFPRLLPVLLWGALLSAALLGACAGAPAPAPEASVHPGINDDFLDPGLSIEQWMSRFEVESREIFAQREPIARALGLKPGDAVADVGAGTGLFMSPFAAEVGPQGKVYALDISPVFVQHLTARARELGLPQVEPRLCRQDSLDLPSGSIDKAFICDTYHHFEYPRHTMESLRDALRGGGEVLIVDFERVPGVSRDWVLEHVRCGKADVIAEVESYGFDLVEELHVPGLAENYALRFRRR